MARYIDADKLLNMLPDDLPYKASVKRVLIQAPTADVVPKSEVDNLKAEIERLRKYNNGIFDVLQLAEYKISKLHKEYTESEDTK